MITALDAEGRHENPNSGTQALEQQAFSVSIVVPTLNNAATIRKCLESISRIDFPRKNVQVVLVDGGSTDGTRRIAEDFPVEVVDEPKKLRGATYNRGLKTARNEYVAFVDGDGFVSSNWLREGLKIFTADPACAAVYFPSEIPSDVTILQRAIGVYQLKGKLIAVDSQEHAGTGANGAIFRRENIEYVGGFDESLTYGQERELDSRLR